VIKAHVWLAPEALVDDPHAHDALRATLPEDEAARLEAFRAGTPRRLYLLARGLQRSMLSRLVPGVAAREWRFERSEAGRPSPAAVHATDLDFNIAHTNGLVVMAAGRGMRLGIDVEGSGRRRSLEIARRYFSAREIAALEALHADAQQRRFIELWTLKEAYLKAIGTGISGGLDSMSFEWRDAGIHFERAPDPDAQRWQFRQWSRGAHVVALACLAAGEVTLVRHEVSAADFLGATSGQEQGPEA
jgi:4'-phosphopantetheinyl transferase